MYLKSMSLNLSKEKNGDEWKCDEWKEEFGGEKVGVEHSQKTLSAFPGIQGQYLWQTQTHNAVSSYFSNYIKSISDFRQETYK